MKIFDDHITVESPGIFPGLVRASSIRHTHFSRNPKIASYLHAYKLVKEFGEGVDRMYREMEEAGCPAPEFKQQDFMVYATIRQHRDTVYGDGELNGQLNGESGENGELNGELNEAQNNTLNYVKSHPGCKANEISLELNIPFSTIDKHIRVLLKYNMIERRGSKKTGGYYAIK